MHIYNPRFSSELLSFAVETAKRDDGWWIQEKEAEGVGDSHWWKHEVSAEEEKLPHNETGCHGQRLLADGQEVQSVRARQEVGHV